MLFYITLCFSLFFPLMGACCARAHKRIVDKGFCQSPAYRSKLTDKLQFGFILKKLYF